MRECNRERCSKRAGGGLWDNAQNAELLLCAELGHLVVRRVTIAWDLTLCCPTAFMQPYAATYAAPSLGGLARWPNLLIWNGLDKD